MSTRTECLDVESLAEQPLVGHKRPALGEPAERVVELSYSRSLSAGEHRRTWRHKLQGWRFGLALNASIATLVLMTNIGLVTVAARRSSFRDSIGSLYTGDCHLVDRANLAIHVLINTLSSILLSASNYAMQCASSPTRQECDFAHARGDWLDIGIPGARNLKRIGFQRRVIWLLLALSSAPIHLLYNSAVFKTLDANNYRYATVPADFLNASSFPGGMRSTRIQYQKDPQMYERLDPKSCISAYSGLFVSGHSNVLLVSADNQSMYDSANDVELDGVVRLENMTSNQWISETRGTPVVPNKPDDWVIGDHRIDSCLARKTEPHCKLEFSLYIMVPVMICNFIKAIAMLWLLLRQQEVTFVTFGDALASWLDVHDKSTRRYCIMEKDALIAYQGSQRISDAGYESVRMHAWNDDNVFLTTISRGDVRRRSAAFSPKRWAITMSLCVGAILIAGGLLSMAIQSIVGEQFSMLDLGFGSLRPNAIFNIGIPQSGTTGLIGCVLFANLPQLIVSVLYLMYNSLYTCMHLAHEYSGYAIERKPLRVTEPKGSQRSTYWLQLPYTYGIPLLLASAALHWLVSQSIFLARVTIWHDGDNESPFDNFGRNGYEHKTISAVGYSCIPLLCVILLGTAMLIVAVLVGHQKLPSNMPVAGSCSAAMAAAAHRPKDDLHASILPVKWGVVTNSDTTVGHVCFTSQEVTELQEGKVYTGIPPDPDVGTRVCAV